MSVPELSQPARGPRVSNQSSDHARAKSTTPNASPIQDLPNYRISLDKLSEKLRSKFGAGSYEIYLMHDVYSVKAPSRLSITEIAECL